MKHLLSILLICSIGFTQELTVEGDLNVTGNIHVGTIDSLQQQISSLLLLITELEQRIAQLECQNTGIIPEGYCDCFFHTLDECLVCGGDSTLDECGFCDLLTEVVLWGVTYDIESTTDIQLASQGLTGSIPPAIECLTNLTDLNLSYNQITGQIPPEIGNLTNLTYLHLGYNQLTGSFPAEIGNLTNLNHWDFTYNQLTGEVPPEVCDLMVSNNLSPVYLVIGNSITNLYQNSEDCE